MQQILDARVSTESQPGVLETAIDEYKHFLQQARSCDTLAPSLLVDLVWHTHQQVLHTCPCLPFVLSVYFSVQIFFNYLQIYLHIFDDAHRIPMIQFSDAYAADCIALAGRLIDHDDDLTHGILDVTLMENNGVLPV